MSQGRLPLRLSEENRMTLGVEVSREHLANRRGSILASEQDWVAAVALSTTPSERKGDHPVDVAAKVALWKEGFDLVFPDDKRKAVLLHASAILGGEGAAIPAVADRVRQLFLLCEKRKEDRRKKAEALYEQVRPLLPEGKKLLEHQKLALLEIEERDHRLVVHDDLGLGKTIEVLASALLRASRGEDPFPLLIAAQTSMVGAWVEHAELWLQALNPKVDDGFGGTGNVVTMPYGKLLDRWREAKELRPATVVYDESHYLKNPESQRAKAAVLCASGARAVLCTTATMDPNGRPEECYLQLKLCDPSLEWRTFRYEYCNGFKMDFGGRKVWNTKGSSSPVAMGKLLHKMSFRRTKAELGKELGLPELSRYVIPVKFGPRAHRLLESEKQRIANNLLRKAETLRATGKKRDEEKAGRIEEAALFAATTVVRAKTEELKVGAAVQRTKELLADGHDVILFCFFPRNAVTLFETLSSELKDTQVLLGTSELSADKRTELVRRAQKEGGVVVLTYAYCEGITLTRFDRVLFVGRHWIPDKETQAEARCDRIGQTRPPAAEYLIARNTIDEAMVQVAVTKETVAKSIVGSTAVRVFRWMQDRPVEEPMEGEETVEEGDLGEAEEGFEASSPLPSDDRSTADDNQEGWL